MTNPSDPHQTWDSRPTGKQGSLCVHCMVLTEVAFCGSQPELHASRQQALPPHPRISAPQHLTGLTPEAFVLRNIARLEAQE